MGLADSAIRLRRVNWKNDAQLLAEELFLILLQDTDPTTGPINITISGGQPAIAGEDALPTFSLTPLSGIPDFPLPDLNLPEFQLNLPAFDNPQNQQQTAEPSSDGQYTILTTAKDQYLRVSLPGLVQADLGDGFFSVRLMPNGQGGGGLLSGTLLDDNPVEQSFTARALLLGGNAPGTGDYVPAVYWVTKVRVTTETTLKMPEQIPLATNTKIKVLRQEFQFVGGTGGGGVPGKVLSGGPGDTYQVEIYPGGLSVLNQDGSIQGATVVTAKQLQIDSGETIPAGTFALITKAGGVYYMQVPVWVA